MGNATVAFFGAGMMGAGFVKALRRRGVDVAVWNRTIAKAQPLAAVGARVAADPAAAAAGAARAHLSLSDDAAVDALLERIVDALPPEAPIIDHTTVSPAGAAARAATLARLGRRFLHAPVFMGPAQAEGAQGLMLCSGPSDLYQSLATELWAMTGEVWYMGEEPGRAAAFKLFGNAMIVTIASGLADVYAMARAQGITPEDAHGLFAKLPVGKQIDFRGAKMARGDFAASFELAMARKDVRLMLDAAGGSTLAVLPAIAARIDALLAAGHARQDLGVLAVDAVRP
ncbi:MAG TPA: NAD(P)-binding domain-containing protein [Haliangiales bacterium]|nr:NAD(P)-binding domain-containing protein [Haliangiales bacterium]